MVVFLLYHMCLSMSVYTFLSFHYFEKKCIPIGMDMGIGNSGVCRKWNGNTMVSWNGGNVNALMEMGESRNGKSHSCTLLCIEVLSVVVYSHVTLPCGIVKNV